MTVTLALVNRFPLATVDRWGGVEHLSDGVARTARDRGIEVIVDPDVSRIAQAARQGSVVVFTQQEGGLSAGYARWADVCLAAGAVVVEKNVFAMPSSHRPHHPRYLHALMSQDGAHRFAWRSAVTRWAGPPGYLRLPNPLRPDLAFADRVPAADGVLRLLRVGREDPVKWTTWEQDVAAAMAVSRPALRVELTLVGLPASRRGDAAHWPSNLTVRELPRLDGDALAAAYARADAYLHHSRIGETYGNTLAEAQAAGCFCIAGLDPVWDCAPLEFLEPTSSWTGTPRRAIAEAGRLAVTVMSRPSASPRSSSDELAPYVDRIIGTPNGRTAMHPLPSARQARAHVIATGDRLGRRGGGLRAVGIETARAVYRRARGDDVAG